MKIVHKALSTLMVLVWLAGMTAVPAEAAVTQKYVVLEPARYAYVDGDSEKYKALNWVQDGYVGGVRDFRLEQTDEDETSSVEVSGHALVDENDLEGSTKLTKEDLGFFNIEYREFSKFYDGSGGTYYPFATLPTSDLGKDLELELGRIYLEAGLRLEDAPAITFFYEREFKDGAKSRLSWASVTDAGTSRNIAPSYQEIDETTDTFGLRIEHEVNDITIKSEQKWELMRAHNTRYEQSLSTAATASQHKQRVVVGDPKTDIFTNDFELSRWADDDSWFWGLNYRYMRINADEVENIFEKNESGTLTNFTSPKQIRDAVAHNRYDSNTWVGSNLYTPLEHVSIITNVKAEVVRRRSSSTYPSDDSPNAAGGATPNGIIDHTEDSRVENKLTRFGEGISVRYTAIPRTAIYGELEFEQTRNWLEEIRVSIPGASAASASDNFGRETIAGVSNIHGTLGTQFSPWQGATGTVQYRRGLDQNSYHDIWETDPTGSTAKSSFVNSLDTTSNELSARFTVTPVKKVRASARYQLRTKDYETQVEDQDNVQTDMGSSIYSFDLTVQPIKNAYVTGSVSWDDGSIQTPERTSAAATTPKFDYDVTTWLMSAYYVADENTILTTSYVNSFAHNFVDFTSIGLPLGTDYESTELSFSVDRKIRKDIHIEPRYSYLSYDTKDQFARDGFDAHVFWMTVTLDLA